MECQLKNVAVTDRRMIAYTGNDSFQIEIVFFFRTKLYMQHLANNIAYC